MSFPLQILSVGGPDSLVSISSEDRRVVGTAQPGVLVQIRRGGTVLGTAMPNDEGDFSYVLTPENITTLRQGADRRINIRQTLTSADFVFRVDTITPLPAPTSPPVVTPPPAPTLGAPTTGWTVNERNVGLAPHGISAASLPIYSGPDVIPAGARIAGVRFIRPITCHLGNIVLERCAFQPTMATVGRGQPLVNTFNLSGQQLTPSTAKVVICDCEFDGSLLSNELGAWATGFWGCADLIRNYFHHLGGGAALYNTGNQLDALVEHNYTVNMLGWGDPATNGNHSDAFTIRDFTDAANPNRKAIIRNNRFMCDSPNTTSAFFIQAWGGRIDNVDIAGNLLEGYGWVFVLEANRNGYSNVSFVNNRINPTPGKSFGAYYTDGGPGFSVFSENYRYDASKVDGKGVPL